ncbi:MAG: plasmid mobilization relaxosome protein MobC [Alistipes communis]
MSISNGSPNSKGLARNLNQLTRQAHAQGFAAVTARHATLQTELVRMIEALRRDR